MKRTLKLVLWVGGAVLAALLVGWVWGASGRYDLGTALAQAELRLRLTEAKAGVLHARVDLYNLNFGDASRRLEDAKAPLDSAQAQLREADGEQAAARLAAALQHIEQARSLANRLDQAANARAGQAVQGIDEVLRTLPPVP
jgi:hypothetical protein